MSGASDGRAGMMLKCMACTKSVLIAKSPLILSFSPRGEGTLELPAAESSSVPSPPRGEGQGEGVFSRRHLHSDGASIAFAADDVLGLGLRIGGADIVWRRQVAHGIEPRRQFRERCRVRCDGGSAHGHGDIARLGQRP